jgi:hypothetical protein
MKQVDIPEWLDTDSGTAKEISDALVDLRHINQRFGGIATMQSMVERVAQNSKLKSLAVLEVASGAGFVPETVRQNLLSRGIELRITLLDRAKSHLPSVRKSNAIVGDALALPFADSSFDIVDCNLFAHHLLPAQLLKFVNEGLRVCRIALLINDLVRSILHLALVYAGLPSFHSPLTRHDAPVSVRRAYTIKEMKELLDKSQAAKIEIQNHYLCRMGVIAWKA